jgi:hypothetical protein
MWYNTSQGDHLIWELFIVNPDGTGFQVCILSMAQMENIRMEV